RHKVHKKQTLSLCSLRVNFFDHFVLKNDSSFTKNKKFKQFHHQNIVGKRTTRSVKSEGSEYRLGQKLTEKI
ncbi:MAG: hypothetical protein ACK4GN_16420, partial [Runella sp.]